MKIISYFYKYFKSYIRTIMYLFKLIIQPDNVYKVLTLSWILQVVKLY